MITFHVEKRTFYFKFLAGTSRGFLTEKRSWFITIRSSILEFPGVGECSIIEGLTPEYNSDEKYEELINNAIKLLTGFSIEQLLFQIQNHFDNSEIEFFFAKNPSVRFGFEMAIFDLVNQKNGFYFINAFSYGKQKIPINGLIWMGDENFMLDQIAKKLKEGFSTLKMKIGSMHLDKELVILRSIRKEYNSDQITLRVDANGAFDPIKVIDVLRKLNDLDIHSIEQPIQRGQLDEMKKLCELNILPIALDEELIGINSLNDKVELLELILPHFIILKPSLHGGIKGVREWIELAEKLGISWWMTSALESNVGLSAICQFTAEYNNNLPQGLGTGSLYSNNIEKWLKVEKGYMFQERNRL